jgi:hypothetical protein
VVGVKLRHCSTALWNSPRYRHCEEQSDEAIQLSHAELDCFAALAMTR